jgi:hypothetical protein
MRQKNLFLTLMYFGLVSIIFQSCGPSAEQVAKKKSLDSINRADTMAIIQNELLEKLQQYGTKVSEEILKQDSIAAIKKKLLAGVRLMPLKIDYSNSLLSTNMSGIPPTIYSKEGIVICKFTMDGNFATGAIAHFYFTNVGSNGKSKFIVILNVTVGTYAEATKAKVVKLDLKKGIYSLDIYLAFEDNVHYHENTSYQDRKINVKLTSPKELLNEFSFIARARRITITKVEATLIEYKK